MARAEVALEGAIHPLVGTPTGDQTHPAAAFGDARGYLVWQDNATDGDGLGISARRLDPNGTPSGGTFRVNQGAVSDQENAKVTMLSDGSALFVWQSGVRGKQSVIARLMGPDGVFKSDDIQLSVDGSDNRNASVAALSDGSAAIAWASSAADGQQLGIHAVRLGSNGQKVGGLVTVNQFATYNQRNPSVAALPAGGYAVAWISEQQTGDNRADVYYRRYGADNAPKSDETRVNLSALACSGTSLVALSNGRLAVAWSELDLSGTKPTWGLKGRWISSNGSLGNVIAVSGTAPGSHTQAQLSVSGDRVLATWIGSELHTSRAGVGARLLDDDGNAIGEVMTLDATGIGDQISPTSAARGSGKFLVAWSNWTGLASGMDITAQSFAPSTAPLAAMGTPVVQGLSSWQVKAAWAAVANLPVKQYEVYFDGASTPEVTTETYWASSDVLPGTSHTVQVAYVLTDGRRSPLSPVVSGKSWGKDANNDGLPDDWQAAYFGPNPAAWPSPAADTDGDGVSNRDEFLSGTNPTDPKDVLKVAVQTTGQGYLLDWSSHPGGIYQLQASQDLTTWSNVGAYRFATSEKDSVMVNDVPGNSYFRVNRIR